MKKAELKKLSVQELQARFEALPSGDERNQVHGELAQRTLGEMKMFPDRVPIFPNWGAMPVSTFRTAL